MFPSIVFYLGVIYSFLSFIGYSTGVIIHGQNEINTKEENDKIYHPTLT